VAIWQRHNIKQPITDRAPDKDALASWVHKEGWSFFRQVYRWINWAIKYLGKVGVDATDVPGVAEAKLVAGSGVSITKVGDAGARQLVFSVTPPPPPPDPEDPVAVGAELLMAHVVDSKLRPIARCVVLQSDGSNVTGLNFLQWTRISGEYTWQYNYTGRMAGYAPGQPGGQVYLAAGDLVIVPFNVGNYPSTPAEIDPKLGLYEVVDPGSSLTQPIIRRAAGAKTSTTLAQGSIFTATESPGYYWTQTAADPVVVDVTPLTLALTAGTYAPQELDEALTASQVSTAQTRKTTVVHTPAAADGLVDYATFTTRALSVSSIPAGPFSAHVLCGVEAAGSGVSWWQIDLYVVAPDWEVGDPYPTPFLTMDGQATPIIRNPYNFSQNAFQAELAAPVSVTPGQKWAVRFRAQTSSVTAVQVSLSYDNYQFFPFYTRIGTTVQMPSSGGTNDHQELLNRDTVNNHFGVGTATTVSGIIPVPTKKTMVVTVDGNPVLQGMHTDGLESGVDVSLTFLQPCSIVGEAAGLPAGQAKFLLSHMDGSSPDNIEFAIAGGRIGVTYYATELPQSPCFQLTWGPLS
jgi:hypothetical protein